MGVAMRGCGQWVGVTMQMNGCDMWVGVAMCGCGQRVGVSMQMEGVWLDWAWLCMGVISRWV